MSLFKSQIVPYHFKAINPTDYELTFILKVDTRILNYVFIKSQKKLSEKNINVGDNINKINSFVVPPEYLKLVKTSMHKTIYKIEQEIKKDNIFILSCNPINGIFKKNTLYNYWEININFGGTYADKR